MRLYHDYERTLDSSLVRRGTSPINARVRLMVSGKAKNRNRLHLWLWQIMNMTDFGYGGPGCGGQKPGQISD